MVKKLFRLTYDDLILLANLFHREFLLYKDEFTAFSTMFEDPFAENFMNKIKAADSFIGNQFNLNHSKILFLQLQDYLKVSRAVYQKLILFLKLIYPNSDSILYAFGQNDYNVARRTALRMKTQLDLAYINANSEPYKSDLIAGGFSQSDIDGLLETANTLNEKLLAHQEFMNHSYSTTAERIKLHNDVWQDMLKINKASKFIFANNGGVLEFFKLKI